MKTTGFFAFIIVLLALVSCERQADLNNPATYSGNGLDFSMPSNWKVTEDEEDSGFRYLFVETPGDAIVIISIYSKQNSPALLEYVNWAIESSTREMPFGSRSEGSIAEFQKTIGQQRFSGYRNEFMVSVAVVDVPHITEYYLIETDSASVFLTAQVSLEDRAKVEQGFDLLLSTLTLR